MTPRLLPLGEAALSVQFGTTLDPALSARVLALNAALLADPPPGLLETVPSYRALTVHFDPFRLPRARLADLLLTLAAQPANPVETGRHWALPACCDDSLAPDLRHIAASTGLTPDAVRRTFLTGRYRIAMFGFAPGWAYLSGLPAALTLPRRQTPRDRIPAGALIIAGGQAIVAGPAMPSGWHILGQTPVAMFDPARSPAILLSPGDSISFDPVDLPQFTALQARAAAGEPLLR